MSKKLQFVSLLLVVAVSIVFGMVVNSTLNRIPKASAETPLYSTIPDSVPVVQAPSFADIAEKANPAVVSIDVAMKVPVQSMGEMPFDDFIWKFFGMPERKERDNRNQQFRRRSPEQQYEKQEGGGSGFIISSDGYILTNNHVVENATKIVVTLQNDDDYEAKVVGTDPQIDIALIKIEPKSSLPVLPFGDSDKLRVGEWVIAIGNPLALKHTVTVGVVSAKSRKNMSDNTSLTSFIQTDAAINFGNSGGPLLNAKGEVIGINTAIWRANNAEGIGFAIPINPVKRILEQLKEKGKVSHGLLGIGVKPVDENKQDYYKLPFKRGAYVDSVTSGLPGDKAGIQEGDIIVSVDGKDIKDNSDLVDEISSHTAGDVVQIGIYRDGKKITLEARLGDRAELAGGEKEQLPEKGRRATRTISSDSMLIT